MILITSYKKNQKGIALITVLFLFALATIIVSGLATLLNTNLQRSSAVLESEQAYLLCLSGEEWARQFLIEDYKDDSTIDHLHEKWAESGKIMQVDHGYIEVSIQDAQGKFNINNLVNAAGASDPVAKDGFQRLINLALLDKQSSRVIAEEATDWLDLDNNGVEETDYLSEAVPYRPPNTSITDVSEMRWLKDVDLDTYKLIHQELFSSLIALPGQTPVNVNTATPQVVAALADLSLVDAENIMRSIQSNDKGYTVASAVALFPQLSKIQNLSANSEYFEVRVRAKFVDHYAFLTTIVFRDPKDGEMSIIARDRSERFIFTFSKDYNAKAGSKDYEIDI